MPKKEVIRTTDIREYRDYLALAFEGAAAWRSGLVVQFPDDDRNEPAAKELSRLAQTVKEVPTTLMEQYIRFSRQDGESASTDQSALLRSVGYQGSYDNAAEFVRALVA